MLLIDIVLLQYILISTSDIDRLQLCTVQYVFSFLSQCSLSGGRNDRVLNRSRNFSCCKLLFQSIMARFNGARHVAGRKAQDY